VSSNKGFEQWGDISDEGKNGKRRWRKLMAKK